MRWSFQVARIGETELRLHATFLLLVAWYAWRGWQSAGPSGAVSQTAFVLLLFVSVALHEFGHILMARRFGIPTPEILLSPIGGIARIARIPRVPRQELAISLAGPAVTLAIVLCGCFILSATGKMSHFLDDVSRGALWQTVILTNFALLLFNLLPAFPMDGGRVTRALLAARLGFVRATRIAARLGQVIALLFIFWGLRGNVILLLIGLFVLTAAEAELQAARRDANPDESAPVPR